MEQLQDAAAKSGPRIQKRRWKFGWVLGVLAAIGVGVFIWLGATGRLNYDDETATRPISDFIVGDCVGAIPEEIVISELDLVRCDVDHVGELFNTGQLNLQNDRPYPGEDAVSAAVNEICTAAFADYVGSPVNDSDYVVSYLYPVAEGWRDGYGTYWCLVVDSTGPSVGSAKDSDR